MHIRFMTSLSHRCSYNRRAKKQKLNYQQAKEMVTVTCDCITYCAPTVCRGSGKKKKKVNKNNKNHDSVEPTIQ